MEKEICSSLCVRAQERLLLHDILLECVGGGFRLRYLPLWSIASCWSHVRVTAISLAHETMLVTRPRS